MEQKYIRAINTGNIYQQHELKNHINDDSAVCGVFLVFANTKYVHICAFGKIKEHLGATYGRIIAVFDDGL